MVIGISCLSQDILVACETKLWFWFFKELVFLILVSVAKLVSCCHFVLFTVNGVTAYTGYVIEIVFRSVPVHKFPVGVTLKTQCVGFGGLNLCRIDYEAWIFFLNVLAGRTVTGFAAFGYHRGLHLKVGDLCVDVVLELFNKLIVAVCTSFGANVSCSFCELGEPFSVGLFLNILHTTDH